MNYAHGTRTAYNLGKCRCHICRDANTAYQRTWRKARTIPVDDQRHGTENAYTTRDCRCESCRKAHALYRQEQRRAYV